MCQHTACDLWGGGVGSSLPVFVLRGSICTDWMMVCVGRPYPTPGKEPSCERQEAGGEQESGNFKRSKGQKRAAGDDIAS